MMPNVFLPEYVRLTAPVLHRGNFFVDLDRVKVAQDDIAFIWRLIVKEYCWRDPTVLAFPKLMHGQEYHDGF